tara:strand:+ start:193 stop:453 length:261 start_codon:yes stop_codon:yes gene_type:complete
MKQIRKQLDEIDRQFLELLAQRKDLVLQLAKLKKESNLPLKQKRREKEVFEKISQLSQELNLNPKFTKKLFKLIIKNSLKQQKSPE